MPPGHATAHRDGGERIAATEERLASSYDGSMPTGGRGRAVRLGTQRLKTMREMMRSHSALCCDGAWTARLARRMTPLRVAQSAP